MADNEFTTWKPQRALDFLELTAKERISLPRYQREKVWKGGQQALLIDSILNDFPIGSLLATREVKDSKTSYVLLDGHQRLSTIKLFLMDPFNNAFNNLWGQFEDDSGNEFDGKICTLLKVAIDDFERRLMSTCLAPDADIIINNINPMMKMSWKDTWDRAGKKPDSTNVGINLIQRIDLATSEPACADVRFWIANLVGEIENALTLKDLGIPVIIFLGPKKDYPELFHRFNTQGTTLSKFQKMAAKWAEVYIDNKPSILKQVSSHAIQIVKSNTEKVVKDMTLAEYFAGFSYDLKFKFPNLFKSGPADYEKFNQYEFSWQVTSYITGHMLSERTAVLQSHLNSHYISSSAKDLDMEGITKVIYKAAEITNNALTFLTIGRTTPSPIRDLRYMAAIVAAVAVNIFPIKHKIKITSGIKDKLIPGIENTIAGRYIFDTFDPGTSEKARNAQLYDFVWDDSTSTTKGSKWLTEKLTKKDFLKKVSDFDREIIDKKSTKDRSATSDQAKILSQFLSANFAAGWAGVTIDHDHLIPRKHINAKPKGSGTHYIVNIDHPGNYGPIDKALNNRKSDKTIAEYYSLVPTKKNKEIITTMRAFKSKFPRKDLEKKLHFKSSELDKVTSGFSKTSYNDFVQKRMKLIASQLADEYYI